MDILYLHVKGEHCESLRFSLRSINDYGINVDRVFICGYSPEWISDEVIKVPYTPDPNLPKGKNIFKQILYAVENTDIGINHGGEFLISMDDHFYFRNIDFNNYPFYVKDYPQRAYRYLLPNSLDYTKASVDYQQVLVNTYWFCLNKGFLTLNTTCHRNMHMNRYLLNESKGLCNQIVESEKHIEGIAIMLNYYLTRYPKRWQIILDFKNDNIQKIKKYIQDKNAHVFSTNDFELDSDIHRFLQTIYPNKSKYEKT